MMMTRQDIIDLGLDPDATYEWIPLEGPYNPPVLLKISIADSYWTDNYPEKSGPMIYTMTAKGKAFAKGTPAEMRRFTRKLP